MYGATGDGGLVELSETPFARELDLQDFLSKHPALLAGDQMDAGEPRRFVLVTAEAGIAIERGAGDYFSLDHLFLDQDGIPTLVEVKRSSDTRLRREVVGQMLEYAANACAFWDVARLRLTFEQRCQADGLKPDAELAKLNLDPTEAPDSIWEKAAQNLRQERLRLVFVADSFAPETQRIIEFLNRQMQLTEVYAVEVRQFTGVDIRTLVPRVLNPSILQTDRRSATSARGLMWNSERFFDALDARAGASAVDVFKKIYAWADARDRVSIFYGRGKSDGSIQIGFSGGSNPLIYQPNVDVIILTLWTYGRADVNFQYLLTRRAFASKEKRQELLERLTRTSTLQIEHSKIDKRPSIKWSELQDARNLRALLDGLDWAVAELTNLPS